MLDGKPIFTRAELGYATRAENLTSRLLVETLPPAVPEVLLPPVLLLLYYTQP